MSNHLKPKIGLDPHAYRGAPRRLGSAWSLIETSPPDPDAWPKWRRDNNTFWRPPRRPTTRKTPLVDRALRLLREMAAAGRRVGR